MGRPLGSKNKPKPAADAAVLPDTRTQILPGFEGALAVAAADVARDVEPAPAETSEDRVRHAAAERQRRRRAKIAAAKSSQVRVVVPDAFRADFLALGDLLRMEGAAVAGEIAAILARWASVPRRGEDVPLPLGGGR